MADALSADHLNNAMPAPGAVDIEDAASEDGKTRQMIRPMLLFCMKRWIVQRDALPEALRHWQAGLARAFVRLDAEAAGCANAFGGRIEQASAGALRISRVTATAHRVLRRKEHAARAQSDVIFANLQLAGRGDLSIGQGGWAVAPMDLCIVPTCDAYAIEHRVPFDLISIALPANLLPDGLEPGRIALSSTATGREIAGVITALAGLSRTLPAASAVLQAQILDTLRLAAAVQTTCTGLAEDRPALRAAIEAHIARRHGDPDLSASPLATAFGLSERRLHALFEETGHSVGARIEAARLQTAQALLETTRLPISVVAARSGFSDPAYFARVFRRACGASPRDWRAARLS